MVAECYFWKAIHLDHSPRAVVSEDSPVYVCHTLLCFLAEAGALSGLLDAQTSILVKWEFILHTPICFQDLLTDAGTKNGKHLEPCHLLHEWLFRILV